MIRTLRALSALALAAFFGAGAVPAAEPGQLPPLYRVEVIVFVHEQGRSDAWPTDELREFDQLLDPLARAEAERLARLHGESAPGQDPPRDGPGDDHGHGNGEALPPPWLAVDELSAPMGRALRRLRDSGAYRPVAWRSWYQPAERGARTPRVRLHDERVVQEIWPEGHDPDAPQSAPARVFGDFVDEPEPAITPSLRYRLDGSVNLRQRQFMHFEVDLEWRDPVRALTGDGRELDQGWQVHRLTDSRPVRTGRLEYFDSGWLGVLVHLQRFEQPVPAPAEPEVADPETGEPIPADR